MRMNMSNGVRSGMSDNTTERVLSGELSTIGKNITPTMRGIITGNARLWASCCVFTQEPTAAKSDE